MEDDHGTRIFVSAHQLIQVHCHDGHAEEFHRLHIIPELAEIELVEVNADHNVGKERSIHCEEQSLDEMMKGGHLLRGRSELSILCRHIFQDPVNDRVRDGK